MHFSVYLDALHAYVAKFERSTEPLGLVLTSPLGLNALMDGVRPPPRSCMYVCVCVHAVDQGHEAVDIPRLGFPGTEMIDGRGHESGLSDSVAVLLDPKELLAGGALCSCSCWAQPYTSTNLREIMR